MEQSGFEEINLFQSMKVLDNVSTKKKKHLFFWPSSEALIIKVLKRYWHMVGEKLFTDGFLCSLKRHNKTEHQRPPGKPPSCDVKQRHPGTGGRRCRSQRLRGAAPLERPLPLPRTTGHLADLKKCHQQLMASVKREDNPHLGVTEPDISLSRNWAKASSPGLCEVNMPDSTTCGNGLGNGL